MLAPASTGDFMFSFARLATLLALASFAPGQLAPQKDVPEEQILRFVQDDRGAHDDRSAQRVRGTRDEVAQPPRAATGTNDSLFTAEDGLEIVSYSALDLTSDGRWLAASSASRRDLLGVDYRRDGDPTYIRPSASRLWVIDTRSGAARAVFLDKHNVRAAKWSPDGQRLALLVLDAKSGVFQPMLWDREGGRLTTIATPPGKYVAENSEVRWSTDGKRVLFALHSLAWRKAAQDSFAVMTAGPVFVQSSQNPFLSWDALRRMGNVRSVVAYDVASRKRPNCCPRPWCRPGS